jgi:hypothetical protein
MSPVGAVPPGLGGRGVTRLGAHCHRCGGGGVPLLLYASLPEGRPPHSPLILPQTGVRRQPLAAQRSLHLDEANAKPQAATAYSPAAPAGTPSVD